MTRRKFLAGLAAAGVGATAAVLPSWLRTTRRDAPVHDADGRELFSPIIESGESNKTITQDPGGFRRMRTWGYVVLAKDAAEAALKSKDWEILDRARQFCCPPPQGWMIVSFHVSPYEVFSRRQCFEYEYIEVLRPAG